MRLHEFQLPKKHSWEVITANNTKSDAGPNLIDLVQTAYQNTPDGSFVNSIRDVIPSDWEVIDWDDHPDLDSCVFFRRNRSDESWVGTKIQGIGHDGQRTSKDYAVKKVIELLHKNGTWIESSDAMRAVIKKHGLKGISNVQFLRKLFRDPNLTMVDNDTYQRKLHSGKVITESVFGKPILKS
jgi:hypothetical protein